VPRLSIIVPTRRLEPALVQRLQEIREHWPEIELLVVEPDDDPGETTTVQAPAKVRRLTAPRGRGTQCHAGALAAAGELLMFLHDDTRLPEGALAALEDAFGDPEVGMVCFRLRFDQRHWLLVIYEWFSQFESSMTTYGDQAMVVRREVYARVGGFPRWPLFEDVEIARRLRKHSRIVKLPLSVVTSATRYRRRGMLSQQVSNGLLRLRYAFGVSPEALARTYESRASTQHSHFQEDEKQR
jgi:rSAM/selenodomain-associated transferase 2